MNLIDAILGTKTRLVLHPAYGRKYFSLDEVLRDWTGGKDFRIHGVGVYCSIRDRKAILNDFDEIFIFPGNDLHRINVTSFEDN